MLRVLYSSVMIRELNLNLLKYVIERNACFIKFNRYPLNLNAELDATIPLIAESASPVTPVPIIILVSVLMFLRVYQICRVIVNHSNLVESSASQSLGYLNKIELNFKFLFKTYMYSAPVVVLLFFITSF